MGALLGRQQDLQRSARMRGICDELLRDRHRPLRFAESDQRPRSAEIGVVDGAQFRRTVVLSYRQTQVVARREWLAV